MSIASQNVLDLFNGALEFSQPGEREAYLADVCGDDLLLRAKISELIQAYERGVKKFDQFVPAREGLFLDSFKKQGQLIDRYTVIEKIGEGGCGVVYVAEPKEGVRRRVALKVIKAGMDTRNVIARFEAERQALAMMDHPNIAKVFDGGSTEGGRPYFVMELVEGCPVTSFCVQNNLSIPERLNLFLQVCDAVRHAHQKGIIHRDLKPSNILIQSLSDLDSRSENQAKGDKSEAGSGTQTLSSTFSNSGSSLPSFSSVKENPLPKVIDFGIAKAIAGRLTDHTIHTGLQQFIGTPA